MTRQKKNERDIEGHRFVFVMSSNDSFIDSTLYVFFLIHFSCSALSLILLLSCVCVNTLLLSLLTNYVSQPLSHPVWGAGAEAERGGRVGVTLSELT